VTLTNEVTTTVVTGRVAPRNRTAPRRRTLGAPVVLLLAVALNVALGVLGYLPYLATAHLVDVVLASLNLVSLQAAVPPFPLVVIVVMLWGLYVPLLVTTNRAVLRRAVVSRPAYLTVAATGLLVAFVSTAIRLWGFVAH
jgi:hypothetical protein